MLLWLLLLLLSRQREAMELWLSLLLCRQWETVEGLSRLMMVVILRPTVGDIANMDRLWAHRRHLLRRLSPWVDPVPDRHLFVFQCLRILVASAFDALVAVLENDAVFLEKLEPAVLKLLALVQVFHLVDQFFELCFVNFAYVVLLKIQKVSATAQEKLEDLARKRAPFLQESGTDLQVPDSREVLPAAREVADGFVLLLVNILDVRLDISPLLE